jgi:hypothetical protein
MSFPHTAGTGAWRDGEKSSTALTEGNRIMCQEKNQWREDVSH